MISIFAVTDLGIRFLLSFTFMESKKLSFKKNI